MNFTHNPNHFDILTVLDGIKAGREMTSLVNAQLQRGWAPHYKVTFFRGFLMQTIRFSGDSAPLPYELDLVQGVSANDMVTQVRDKELEGWETHMSLVSTDKYLYQWMMKVIPGQTGIVAVEGEAVRSSNKLETVLTATPILRIRPFMGQILAGEA